MNQEAIGAYIALLRRNRSLTQRELANRLGVSCQAVSKWENSENLPDAGILLPLAEALHTTTDAILSAGTHRIRQPIDMNALHGGVAALSQVMTAFGAASSIGQAIDSALYGLGISLATPESREQLLTEAILHHLLQGATITDTALEAAIQDATLRERIRKCRHDCALFADKQQYYDDFRPSYPAAAVAYILQQVGSSAVIADIGSGTGKLAVLLADYADLLYAVEPSIHMRRILAARTANLPAVQIVSATAESTGLPDHSVDAITAAEAYHWFDNKEARTEFLRILKPGGCIFLLWNRFVRNPYHDEMHAIQQRHRTYPRPDQRTYANRADDLFGPGKWECFTFDNTLHQTFNQFYGGMSSASYAPEEGTVAGKAFREDVQALFDKYAVHGRIVTHVETVVYAGTLNI